MRDAEGLVIWKGENGATSKLWLPQPAAEVKEKSERIRSEVRVLQAIHRGVVGIEG